jgi:uncharacterized membrane protein YozB (DUF420 family)
MVNFDIYTLVATSNLIIQIAILALLTYGYMLKRKFKFRQHGKVMATAVFLVFGIMIPAFVIITSQFIVPSPLILPSVTSLVHAIAGSTALIMGVWLVAAWGFKKDFKGCFKRRRFMPITFTVWTTAIAFGVIFYVIFYGYAWLS